MIARTHLGGLAVAAAAIALVAGAADAATTRGHDTDPRRGGTIKHWTIDGVRRHALVVSPRAARAGARAPLVIAFHGHGGDPRSTAARMRIHMLWPQAVVVYPQGLNTPTPHDPAGTASGWQGQAGELGDRDLELFDAIVATMKRSYPVDHRRIYATGFSNGAVFSLLLWAERSQVLAAIGEVAGRLHPSATPTSPRALLAVAGRGDTVAPFAVQRQTIRRARLVNGAFGPGSTCGRYCTLYPSTGGPVPVKAFVHPGGHVYPAWASTEIVRFFRSHRQP